MEDKNNVKIGHIAFGIIASTMLVFAILGLITLI